jgi:hypothetical protein
MADGHSREDRNMHLRAVAMTALTVPLIAHAGFAAASPSADRGAAFADRCSAALEEPFRSEAELKGVVESFGYRLIEARVDSGCYVVVAADRRGRLFNIRFRGADLKMVSRYAARHAGQVAAR